MALTAFSRLASRLQAHLGLESVLRGEVVDPPRRINVKHGVQFTGYGSEAATYRGDLVLEKSVATILKEYNPKVGDELDHPDGNYKLDTLHADNGYTMQFILIERGP